MANLLTPLEMMQHWAERFPDQVYLRQSTGSDWLEYTWKDVADRVSRIAAYLADQAFPPGSSVAIWSTNSADWFVADLAIMLSGHVTVPINPAQDIETAAYIMDHSDSKLVFAGGLQYADRFFEALPDGVFSVGMSGSVVQTDETLDGLISRYEAGRTFAPRGADEIATIIYSSGTSGAPKGVVHTFRSISNAGSMIAKAYGRLHFSAAGDERERVISYLPLAHAAERALVEMASFYNNPLISISSGLDNFASEVREVRPTFFGAVPRIWYKFKEGIEAYLSEKGKAIESEEDKAAIRAMLGLDDSRFNMTGSAPVSPQVHGWYSSIGVPLSESYSLTETFSHGTFWDRDEPCLPGCVGRGADGIEVKLDDAGQILFKTPTLMRGYFKNPELTDEVIRDGWFATGDLGRFDDQGNLWVTGRVGSVFKSGKGKFIHPEKLEHSLNKDAWVEQAMVFGSGFAQPVAVIALAQSNHEEPDEIVKQHFSNVIDAMNAGLPAYERIAAALVVRDVWGAESGELTPTLKIRRNVLAEKYAPHLNEESVGVLVG
jgi:long-chain acyl-CoA synthetase